jgi:class 3 adenylate cyclase
LENLQGSFKNVTAWFIDIRKYTALSNTKDLQVVINFIKEYRELVVSEFKNESNGLTDNICEVIYIGDAVLIILDDDSIDILKKSIKCSKKVRDKMLELLSTWIVDDRYTGQPLTFLKKISFGIGISQGMVYVENDDYIGSTLNDASKIGDTRQLSKNNTHIGIDKDVFYKLDNREIDKDCECIGYPKDCKYVDLLRFERKYGIIND